MSFILCSLRNALIKFSKMIITTLRHILCIQCQTLNEEEIFEVQDKLSLFPLGWIHVSAKSSSLNQLLWMSDFLLKFKFSMSYSIQPNGRVGTLISCLLCKVLR